MENTQTKQIYPAPAVLSLVVPGLGQMVKKQDVKGTIFLFLVFILAVTFVFDMIETILNVIAYLVVCCISVYDAYNSSKDIK